MIKFAVEPFSEMYEEMRAYLLMKHWEELALDRDKISLSFNWDLYLAMEKSNSLHVLTVRDGARLVGYFVAFVFPHLHYAEAGIMAHTDVYYLLPEYRTGNGAKMFCELERTLIQRGVIKIYLSTKVHADHGALFERLGYKQSDKVYTKMVK